MSTLTTRSSKGSELSHNELDANFKRTVSQKTTTYACLVSDNRSVIEGLHASTPFTVTLGDANTMDAADTGDYEVTIANIGAAAVTVARAGTDTIEGVATSIVLQQYSSITLKVNAAGDGYNSVARGGLGGLTSTVAELNILDGVTSTATELNLNDGAVLRHKVIDIGDWDMVATTSLSVSHNLTWTKIRPPISAMVRNDAGTQLYPVTLEPSNTTAISLWQVDPTVVRMTRAASGLFDGPNFDATSYNRGWITIWYVD